MLKSLTFTLTTALSLVTASTTMVQAAVLNGSFETGDFANWISTGQTSVETSDFGVAPTDGTYQAVLETLQDKTEVTASDLESFLAFPPPLPRAINEGDTSGRKPRTPNVLASGTAAEILPCDGKIAAS
jgi:hypothetical protein